MEWEKVSIDELGAALNLTNPELHTLTGFLAMLSVPAFVKDKKGRVLFLNKKAQQEWKVSASDAIGKTVASLTGSRELEYSIKRNEARVLRHMSGYVFNLVNKDAHLFTLLFPVADSDGDVLIAGLVMKTHG